MKKQPRIPLVEVTWDDAHALPAVEDLSPDELTDEQHSPYVMHSIGWVLRQDESGISPANEYTWDRDAKKWSFRGITFIPAGMVRRVKRRRRS